MIVPRGAKFFPNQAPLLGMTIPTVEGNLRLGYSPRARKSRGMGLLLPVDPTVPQPRTNRRTIPVRGVGVSRGFGRYRGLGADYCSSNPPDAATAAILAARGDSVNLIDCAPGTTTNPTPTASFQNNPNAMIGTQPVEVLPPTPAYADCNPSVLGEAGSTACAAANALLQKQWIDASGVARNDFNRNMCQWNGQPASYCNQVYPPGYSGGNSPTTQPIAIPAVSSAPAAASYNPVATFTTPNGQTPQVGDPWSISIKGGQPNAQVIVTQTVNGGAPKSGQFGSTDGGGNFSSSGTFTPDTVGSWTEAWTVGGAPAGSFNFQVVVPIPPTTSGGNPPASKSSSAPSSTAGTPPSAPSNGGGVPAGGGINLGGFDLSAVPTWGWIAAAGVGAVLLFGGHK